MYDECFVRYVKVTKFKLTNFFLHVIQYISLTGMIYYQTQFM